MRNGVLAAGNWIVDTVKMVDVYPAQDCLANILAENKSNGGGPYNLLVDMARLGVSFPLAGAGLVGQDAAGASVLEECDRMGIDRSGIRRTADAPTSYTDVMSVVDTGRRTFFHRRGANALLDEDHIELTSSRARIFYLGYLLLLDKLDRRVDEGTGASVLLRRAREAGMTTAVDVVSEDSGRFRDVVLPALRHTDILFMNEIEAERTTGLEVLDALSCAQAADILFNQGVGKAVFIHMESGAFGRVGERTAWQGSVRLPPDRIKGAVGAGDAFAAGALTAWHEGAQLEECLGCGVCVAAACLTAETSSGGVRSMGECLGLGDEFGFR